MNNIIAAYQKRLNKLSVDVYSPRLENFDDKTAARVLDLRYIKIY